MQLYSSKLNIQLLGETFIQSGIDNVVISPGSRNGGLTMQFVNDKRFNCYSIVDERCACFVALGMAQVTKKPVLLSCTSGSAATNYYPAITEAFYQNVPLIVLTADRPASYTDQFDGQTIRQENLFQQHSCFNTQLEESEVEIDLKNNFQKIKQAIEVAIQEKGPVHINMPFSEPLYNSTQEQKITIDQISIHDKDRMTIPWKKLSEEYYQTEKVMFLIGMQHEKKLEHVISRLSDYPNVIVLTETTSNLHHDKFISKIDATLRTIGDDELEAFQPDLLITLGQNVISKRIKQFLRENKPSFHWHIDEHWHPNTYFSLTQKVDSSAYRFIKEFLFEIDPLESDYQKQWLKLKDEQCQIENNFCLNLPWCDFFVFKSIIESYPSDRIIHYSNSSVIRYSQLFTHARSNEVFCNRGTSGIDGSTSTAIGHALKAEKPVTLVTGDISFFYDSNALWNNYIPTDFRIILINNGGGNIFKIIPGPSQTRALDKFFETKHDLTAEHLAIMFNFEYYRANNKAELHKELCTFYHPSERPKILEVNTKKADNAKILKEFINK